MNIIVFFFKIFSTNPKIFDFEFELDKIWNFIFIFNILNESVCSIDLIFLIEFLSVLPDQQQKN